MRTSTLVWGVLIFGLTAVGIGVPILYGPTANACSGTAQVMANQVPGAIAILRGRHPGSAAILDALAEGDAESEAAAMASLKRSTYEKEYATLEAQAVKPGWCTFAFWIYTLDPEVDWSQVYANEFERQLGLSGLP